MAADPSLKRGLSLWLLTFFGLGNILGAGIYVLIGEVVGRAAIYAPVAFLVASLVAAFTAFTYMELSTRYPLSAGEAVYVRQGLRSIPLSVLVGLMIVAMGAVSSATIARGFVGYLGVLVEVPDVFAIVGLLLLLGGLAAWGIKQAVGVAAVLTLIEIAGLLLVIGVAGDALFADGFRVVELVPPMTWHHWNGILFGAFLAFYAFIGFEDMVNVAEEVERPARDLPMAILLALLIASALYVVVTLVAVAAVPVATLAASDAPLATIFAVSTGQVPWVLSLIGMLAVVNGALVQIIMGSRVLYGMSRQGWLPQSLGRVSGVTRTPLLATSLMTGLVIVLALWLPLVVLAQATSFLVLLVFILVHAALLRVKLRDPRPRDATLVPIWVPVGGVLTCLGLLSVQVGQWL